jgi:hypothetical protein
LMDKVVEEARREVFAEMQKRPGWTTTWEEFQAELDKSVEGF